MAGINTITILYAVLGGMVPTFLWLWFWLAEENDHRQPVGLIVFAYLGGILAVLVLLPTKPFIQSFNFTPQVFNIVGAGLEELAKFLVVALITFSGRALVEATDYTIFLVTGALGFSALENTLYLINPILQKTDLGAIIITGNMRFLGATVLHSMSVAIVGVALGLAFSEGFFMKCFNALVGLALAIALHSAFDYFIMQNTRQGTIIAIAGIWFVAVIIIIIFDRLRALQAHVGTLAQGTATAQPH